MARVQRANKNLNRGSSNNWGQSNINFHSKGLKPEGG
jgi:hypothetical protein